MASCPGWWGQGHIIGIRELELEQDEDDIRDSIKWILSNHVFNYITDPKPYKREHTCDEPSAESQSQSS